jgi:transmembrane sensor
MTKQQKLCIKDITGNISEFEKRILNEWLAKSSNNKNEYEQLNRIWKGSEASQLLEMPDVNLQLENISSIIGNDVNMGKKKFIENILPTKIVDNWKPILASSVLLLIIASLYFVSSNSDLRPNTEVIKTAENKVYEFSLPEGSYVKLIGNSSISYTEEFGEQNREIILKGEGFFSVKKDKHPFLIQTENAKVKVTGTQLYVLSKENITRVFVKEGKVNYYSKNTADSGHEIKIGQIGVVSGNKKSVMPIDISPARAVDWMNGKFDCERKSLNEIINELEVYYDVKIEATKAALNKGKLTGTFTGEKIESILDMICLALHLDYVKRSDGYFIKTIDK